MLWTLFLILASVALDQWTKYLAVVHLQGQNTLPLLPDILHFTYVENRGAAFGMLSEHRWVFMSLSVIAILLVLFWIFREKPKSIWVRVAAAFIVGGGIGNMIDRVRLGYVVDFIDVRAIDFYVFNIADSFVCIGCGMILVWVFWNEWKTKKEAAHDPAVSADTKSDSADSSENETNAGEKP